MTQKGKVKWWSGAGFWAAMVFLLCVACAIALFGTYGHYFPTINGFRDDWNVFGALIGGFGSCIGAVATLSTLLFLAHQNRKQQDFTDWQIKTQTFDRYTGHRQLFIDRLAGLQTYHENSIVFSDPDALYSSLFPKNNTSNVDFKVEPERDELTGNYLGLLSTRLEALDGKCKDGRWDTATVHSLVEDLLNIAESLGYQWLRDGESGDILFFGKNYGINIYSLKEFVDRANSIHNAFLRFTGNAEEGGFNQGNCGGPREVLIRYFLRRFAPKHATVAVKSSKNVVLFEKVYVLSETIRNRSQQRIMPMSYQDLSSVFNSREGSNQLADPATLKCLTDKAYQEVTAILEGDHVDGPHVDDELNSKLNEVRVGLVTLKAIQ